MEEKEGPEEVRAIMVEPVVLKVEVVAAVRATVLHVPPQTLELIQITVRMDSSM